MKPKLGHYKLSTITTATLQEFINKVYLDGSYSKNFLKNILKVLKTSFGYANETVNFIKTNPAEKVRLPRYDIPDSDPAHIFTKEEIERILNRFTNNPCAYYAFLTAYHTGLRVSEVFGLSWEDIVFNSLSKNNYPNKTKVRNAVKNLNDEMERASEEFSKLFNYGKERCD